MAADPRMDFSQMTDVQVVEVAKTARAAAEMSRATHLERLGRACAHLNEEQGWTWERIGEEMGVSLTTAWRWAKPYLHT